MSWMEPSALYYTSLNWKVFLVEEEFVPGMEDAERPMEVVMAAEKV